jgi:hypothetical protein
MSHTLEDKEIARWHALEMLDVLRDVALAKQAVDNAQPGKRREAALVALLFQCRKTTALLAKMGG